MADPSLRPIRTARLVSLRAPRPSLLDLWAGYRWSLPPAGTCGQVPERAVLVLFSDQPVHRADAEKVLLHLSILLHKVDTLSTVAVVLIDDGEDTDGAHTDVFQKSSRHAQRGL